MKEGRKKGLAIALIVNKIKRERVLREIRDRIKNLPHKLKDKEVAKIALAMLYLGEGTKNTKGSLVFANSDAEIIQLFLKLLRYSYHIKEERLHCVVQCRADQDTDYLNRYWSQVTQIPLSRFYKPRIDPRTFNKPTKKKDYY